MVNMIGHTGPRRGPSRAARAHDGGARARHAGNVGAVVVMSEELR